MPVQQETGENWNPEGCVKDFRVTDNSKERFSFIFLIERNNDVENAIKSSGEEEKLAIKYNRE